MKQSKEESGLFDKDPSMRLRDSRGRYATPLRAYADKAIEENKRLRAEKDKWFRAWKVTRARAGRLEKELMELRKKIALL